ncbi:zinc finger protein ZXDC [Syngnathus typhle]
MEIQGLCDASNVHSQHGAPHADTSSAPGPLCVSIYRLQSQQDDADLQLEPSEFEINNDDDTPRASPLRLLAENGSEVDFSPVTKMRLGDETNIHNRLLCNVSTEDRGIVSTSTLVVSARRVDDADSTLQMAPAPPPLPPQREEELARRQQQQLEQQEEEQQLEQQQQQLTLPFPVLRHQRGNGASKPPSLTSHNLPGLDRIASKESHNNAQELYLVFNVYQDDWKGERDRHRLGSSSKMWDNMKRRGLECPKATPVEFANASHGLLCSSTQPPDGSDSTQVEDHLTNGSVTTKVGTKATDDCRTVEDVVLTNKYGEKLCGQLCTENGEGKALRDFSFQARNDSFISTSSDMVETTKASQFILDDVANSAALASNPDSNGTFSGTIMINNQTIVVSIENGTLTLAAPSDGYVHKEDDLVSLKEHLGMKGHEDIVLLNYDGGTKAIGKISTTLAVSSHQEEGRPGLSICDSVTTGNLASKPTSSPALHSGSVVKQEAAAQVLREEETQSHWVSASPSIANKDSKCGASGGGASGGVLFRSSRAMAVSFACPQAGCSCTFDTRQKLKVHLLNHAEDPRPYRCTVEGCGWAFATSYKLKRHLQSHNKQRPHTCHFEGCGRCFTTVYNLKAHSKVHEQDDAFVCEICSERFRSQTRLANHQRVHFEPQRPHKCEFPGCEKTFITFSALYSHNRTHFRETGHFTCTYPGCAKMYDKACRLKLHLRSHTGERPFVCDSEGCGWSFTSMSKLLRHKRKHDDDRRFVCTEEGCGKSFTRAEHLKGHTITHLGTKPFQCHAEGCNAKFSARSSLYIHSKKHKEDASTLRTRCPVSNCSKHFSSRSTLKSHMLRQHQLSPDVLSQMESTPTLTPSSELISPSPVTVPGSSLPGSEQLTNLDLSSLFSNVSSGSASTSPAGIGVGIGVGVGGSHSNSSGTFTMDLSLVTSGILAIEPSAVGPALAVSNGTAARPADPLGIEMGRSLGGTVGGDVLPPQGTLNLDDVQSVTPEALGALTSLAVRAPGSLSEPALEQPLGSSGALGMEAAASLAVAPVSELLASPTAEAGGHRGLGTLSCVQNGGSARTDYRAIQLAKRRKQICPSLSGDSGASQRKAKGAKSTPSTGRYGEGGAAAASFGGLHLRDSSAQFVQIQLLQDEPGSDGDLAFQLTSQPSASHSQLTVDLPVNILQETTVSTEENSGSDDSQFTESTINLQDLE